MEGLTVVELHMMDMKIFFPLCTMSSFSIRTLLYPLHLIKTRMQIQRHYSLYSNLPEAFRKISKAEGIKGLYRGFWISNLTIFSQLYYIGAYETARNYLSKTTNPKLRSFIAGGIASVVGQTTVLPIDIVSQHLQVYSLRLAKQNVSKQSMPPAQTTTQSTYSNTNNSNLRSSNQPNVHQKSSVHQQNSLLVNQSIIQKHSKTSNHCQSSNQNQKTPNQLSLTKEICKDLYRRGGVMAFYKGYWASLFTYGPSSALWWLFYDVYCSELDRILPENLPRLMVQCLAAPLGGATTTVIMTPMDAVRARIQVENTAFMDTCRSLWREERWGVLRKGLSARLFQSTIFSTLTILSYESIKRLSLLEEYQGFVRW